MFENITQLLRRYNFQPTERMQKEATVMAIKEATGITVVASQVHIQGKTLYLNVRPACRSELVLSRVAILEALRKNPLTQHIAIVR